MAISTLSFTERKQAESMAATLAASVFLVREKRVQTVEEAPPLPFTTLTLLEDATLRYGWSGERTMQIAQSLFEGGLITYPRTDSTHTDPNARETAWSLAKERYGIDAVPKAMPILKTRLGSKAHMKPSGQPRPQHSLIKQLFHWMKRLYTG